MSIEPNKFVLYILMRNDLPSLNPGKAMAQAHHAGTQMMASYDPRLNTPHCEDISNWMFAHGLGNRFGTVLVLAADIEDIVNMTTLAHSYGMLNGVVKDPSYPIRDGNVVHTFPLITCGYILCRKKEAEFLRDLPLYP